MGFWLVRSETEDGDFLFPYRALQQLSVLSWVLSHTYEDGFHDLPDWVHRNQEPIASVRVAGEDPFAEHDAVPGLWTPVAYVLQVGNRAYLPLVVETLRDKSSLIHGKARPT